MLNVKIGYDSCCDFDECAFELHSFNRRHKNFLHPDDVSDELNEKIQNGRAFYVSYYEHGNCLWFRANSNVPAGVEFQWDGRKIAGIVEYVDEYEVENMDEAIDSFLKVYTDWANGNCYYCSITDDNGEFIDSCGGFIGSEHLADYLADIIGDKDFVLNDDFSWLQSEIENKMKEVSNG